MSCPHNFAVQTECLLCRVADLESELAAEVALADRLAEVLGNAIDWDCCDEGTDSNGLEHHEYCPGQALAALAARRSKKP